VVLHAASRPLDAPLHRRATWLAALLLGLACATKWSGIPLIAVAIGVLVVLAGRAVPPGPLRRDARLRSVAVLVLVPAAVGVAALVPTLLRYPDSGVARSVCEGAARCDTSLLGRVTGVLEDQADLVRFHRSLDPENRFASSAGWWVVQARGTGLLLSRCASADPVCGPADGDVARRIVAVGNPLVWAAGFVAVGVQGWWAARRRDVVALVLAGWATALWLPWVFGGRPGYSFYGVALVPVLAIATARLLGSWPDRARAAGVAVVTVVTVAGAVVLHPLWTAHPTAPSYLSWLVPDPPPAPREGDAPVGQPSGS
jgi:hypothetical protein